MHTRTHTQAVAKMYYRGASAAVIVYDITSGSSFERAKEWVAELLAQCGEHEQQNSPLIVLAGNKLDLVTENPEIRRVSTADVQTYAEAHAVHAIETSAKEASNVNELFISLAQRLVSRCPSTPGGQPAPQPVPLGGGDGRRRQREKGGCCK